jgi:ATP-binding cassette subfamily B protein
MTETIASQTPPDDRRGPGTPGAGRPLSSNRERAVFLLGERRGSVIALAICSIAAAITEAGILAITAQVATALVNDHHHINATLGPVAVHASVRDTLYVALGLAFIRLLLQAGTSYFPGAISSSVQRAMRRRLLHSYATASWELKSQDREGHFQELMTTQIQQASIGALQSTQFIISFTTFLILSASAFALNVVAAAVVLAAALLLLAALRPLNKFSRRLSKRLSNAQLEYAGAIGETNRVTEEMSVFGVWRAQERRVDRYIENACRLLLRANSMQRLGPNVYQSMIYFILVAGLLAISLANVRGFSSLGAVVLLLVRAGSYGQQVQTAWVALQQALPYVERIQESSDTYARTARVAGHEPLGPIETIAFDSVSYGYDPARKVLKGLTFSVNGNETIGVVGPSGAGKSTMVQMLLGLRLPQDGEYAINGTSVSQLRPEDWHRKVAYVPQQPQLVHATVAENVRFFRDDITDAAVERACRLARIHDDIMSWTSGYETIIGPRADAVSGGQQQRICLARALVVQPELLILDEPTSALDPRSESLIQQSLIGLQRELTLFIIAHRMATLTICDRVMVIVDGALDAFDTVSELQRSNMYYRGASGLDDAEGDGGPAAGLAAPPDAPPPDAAQFHRNVTPVSSAKATRSAAKRVRNWLAVLSSMSE